MSTPLVSFVIPCFNYARFLPDCLQGILAQEGYQDWEIIAIDDGSTDNTLAVLNDYAKVDSRFRIIVHEKNKGHIEAVNRGLAEARGKYLVRIDPDDRHRCCFLKETIPKLEAHPEVGLVYGDVALINEQGQITVERSGSPWGKGDRKGCEFAEILAKNYICAPTVVARREAWMSAWPVPDHLCFNDWYFNVMLARNYDYYYVDKVVADYRVHGQNHHSKVVLNKTEEPSVLWVLDKVYSEQETNPEKQKRKMNKRNFVYASQYIDFAEKYFSINYNSDAKRCYLLALHYFPYVFIKNKYLMHLIAVCTSRAVYESLKNFFNGKL